jgi:hypothetical protein
MNDSCLVPLSLLRRAGLASLILVLPASFASVLAAGCGSSSTTTPDAGHPVDSGHGHPDAGPDAHHSASSSKSTSTTSSSTTTSKSSSSSEAPKDAGVDVGSCSGLDAAFSGLAVSGACESCIGSNCCSLAHTCAMTAGCKEIEECATACVAGGTAPMACAEKCIAGDAGVGDAGNGMPKLNAAQNAAYSLDGCLLLNCSKLCGS